MLVITASPLSFSVTSVIRRDYQKLVAHPSLSEETRTQLLEELEAGLQGYAYLEDE